MIAALNRKDVNGIFQHVSEDFQLGILDKAGMRRLAEQGVIGGERVRNVEAWAFKVAFPKPAANEKPTGIISFYVKLTYGTDEIPQLRCEVTFVRDADGQWRMKTFQVFPLTSKDPYTIPGS
jgi:hypothetical protein